MKKTNAVIKRYIVWVAIVTHVVQTLFTSSHYIQVVVKTGFKTLNDGWSAAETDYYRSGCGIELEFKSGVSGNVDDIVTAVLKTCPVPMMVSVY